MSQKIVYIEWKNETCDYKAYEDDDTQEQHREMQHGSFG